MMNQRGMILLSCCLALVAGVFAGPQAKAADLDEAYQAPRPRVIAGIDGRALDPRCRVISQPEHNLYGDTARFRPTLICMSRGMLADSFGPYPLQYPYTNR